MFVPAGGTTGETQGMPVRQPPHTPPWFLCHLGGRRWGSVSGCRQGSGTFKQQACVQEGKEGVVAGGWHSAVKLRVCPLQEGDQGKHAGLARKEGLSLGGHWEAPLYLPRTRPLIQALALSSA